MAERLTDEELKALDFMFKSPAGFPNPADEIRELRAENAELRGYARHGVHCHSRDYTNKGVRYSCDCGLVEVLGKDATDGNSNRD